ncbi:hypothetical protein, partial [Nocardia wallacei]|uniref:hypothetical protein n=1 Tax=Nocardia wallacei TaxID=480035 RepID=UPI00245702D0
MATKGTRYRAGLFRWPRRAGRGGAAGGGRARRALAPARLPAAIAGAAARLSGDPAAVLLETAVLQDLFERGGVVP